MNIIKEAKKLLRRYEKLDFTFESSLKDTDFKAVKTPLKPLGFFKIITKDYQISLPFALQVIKRHTIMSYEKLISGYIKNEIHPELDQTLFGKRTQQEVNELKTANKLVETCQNINEVYINKLDNAEFDRKVSKFAHILTQNIKLQHVAKNENEITQTVTCVPELFDTTEHFLNKFNKQNNQLLNKTQNIEESQQNEESLEKKFVS